MQEFYQGDKLSLYVYAPKALREKNGEILPNPGRLYSGNVSVVSTFIEKFGTSGQFIVHNEYGSAVVEYTVSNGGGKIGYSIVEILEKRG